MLKILPANAEDTGDVGSIPESGRSPGERNSNPPQYPCLENSMDKAWQATVHGVKKSQTPHNMSMKGGEGPFLSLCLFKFHWKVLELHVEKFFHVGTV